MALPSPREQCEGMTTSNDKEPIVPSYIFAPFYSPWLMPPTRAPDGPGVILRARVWIRALELDAALAGGADPARSEELELRAKQLAGSQDTRRAWLRRSPISSGSPTVGARRS